MLKDIILGILIIAIGLWFIYQSAKEYDEYQLLIQKKELDDDDRIEIKYLLTFFLKSVTIGLICIIGGMMVLLGIWLSLSLSRRFMYSRRGKSFGAGMTMKQ